MKKVVLSAIFFMMAMLAACTKYQINEEQSDNNNPFPDYVYNQEKEQGVYGQSDMAIAENGYYYVIDNVLYFYNINSDVNMPLCSKVNCNHDGETCDAYVSGINTENGTFECNCMNEKVIIYIVLRLLKTGIIIYASMMLHLEIKNVLQSLHQ